MTQPTLYRIGIQDHHDGHGLADKQYVCADARDPVCGNASHTYVVRMGGVDIAYAQFQHGARDEEDSTPGCIDGALITILLDRYRGFQAGPFACPDNAVVIIKLEEALMWMRKRADACARRGVLGKNLK